MSDAITCETCDREGSRSAAIRTEPYADLNSQRWQSLCCPDCGRKLETVLVRPDE